MKILRGGFDHKMFHMSLTDINLFSKEFSHFHIIFFFCNYIIFNYVNMKFKIIVLSFEKLRLFF